MFVLCTEGESILTSESVVETWKMMLCESEVCHASHAEDHDILYGTRTLLRADLRRQPYRGQSIHSSLYRISHSLSLSTSFFLLTTAIWLDADTRTSPPSRAAKLQPHSHLAGLKEGFLTVSGQSILSPSLSEYHRSLKHNTNSLHQASIPYPRS